MNFAIVDDEQTQIDVLSEQIREYALQEKVEITIDAYHSGEALLEKYRPYAYTAVFLDIYLEGMNGISTAEKLLAADRSAVILFLTSSDAHMPDAFSLHAYDYITKPFSEERIFKVLGDICLKSSRYQEEPKFTFFHNGTRILLSFSDVALVRTDRRNYLEILDARGTSYLTRMTFQSAAEALSGDPRFLQILRGVLVNMQHIRRIEKEFCYLTNGERLSLNVRNRAELTAIWQNYQIDLIRNERRTKIKRIDR